MLRWHILVIIFFSSLKKILSLLTLEPPMRKYFLISFFVAKQLCKMRLSFLSLFLREKSDSYYRFTINVYSFGRHICPSSNILVIIVKLSEVIKRLMCSFKKKVTMQGVEKGCLGVAVLSGFYFIAYNTLGDPYREHFELAAVVEIFINPEVT